jgi:putative phosphoribosyl transferase
VVPDTVSIPAGAVSLEGELKLPIAASGVIAFAHGSGSSRLSPRNQSVAEALRDRGLGTLLFDLLDREEEARDARESTLRFDIPLLSRRLIGAIDWLAAQTPLPVGCFGASTGAAAALVAAAQRPYRVRAVVSRGGRPDLAGDALPRVRAPTLLIVGGADAQVIALNQEAEGRMTCQSRLEIVPGAGHLFEQPGALERVAELARDWFLRRLRTQ